MELKLFRSLWGVADPWEEAFPRIKADGFTGVEYLVPPTEKEARWRELLDAHELDFLPLIFTRGTSVDDHLTSFSEQMEQAASFAPARANCHAGHDYWSRRENERFFAEALALAADAPFEIGFETHRGRIFFNPWVTRDLLERFPILHVTCDLSQWVVVCERLLTTEEAILEACAERCVHIHARVGHEEGPQVADPRAPEVARHLEAHEQWWQMIWDAQAERGLALYTLCPEIGPPPYQQTLPYTGAPVADADEITKWMAERQLERFRQWKGRS